MAATDKLRYVLASTGRGKLQLHAAALFIGEDISVSVWGGSKPHIGSIAVSVPRPSLANSKKISSTTSIYNFVGHKDDTVAKIFSEKISVRFNRKVVVTAGIHIDDITKKDIVKVMSNAKSLSKTLIEEMETLL